MLDKDFVSLRLESFSNSPRIHCKRDHLPSSLHILHQASSKLAPRSAMRGCILTRPLSNVRVFTFYREYVRSCLPQHYPTDPALGMTWIPSRPRSSSTRSPFPILPRPQARYGSGTARRRSGQDAW